MAPSTSLARAALQQPRTLLAPSPARAARLAAPAFASSSARRLLSSASKSKIDKAVKASPLVVFMKGTPQLPQCGFSRAVIQVLEMSGVAPDRLKTYNCLDDEELRQDIKEYSDWPTIPQVYVDGEFLGGCDIMLQQYKDGSLAQLLADKGIVSAEAQK